MWHWSTIMDTKKNDFERHYAEIERKYGRKQKRLDRNVIASLISHRSWRIPRLRQQREDMSRSLFEGYAPCFMLALIGYNAFGGTAWSWAAFVWIFGAVLTVAVAYMRERAGEPLIASQGIQTVENC